ncbi:hypothetical protein CgS9114_04680 [Corynebacterium glutamicum S9114]|nr:hypothetical protein CgS9114_04680 [Corynebacterium glutamicum S9114]
MSGFLTEVGVKKSNLTQTYSTTAAPKTQKSTTNIPVFAVDL